MLQRETSFTFTQADFDEFARISGDDNPIHVDPDFSSRTKFGRTVAHGMMLFAFLSAELSRLVEGDPILAAQELSFRSPTFTDEEVQARLVLSENRVDQLIVKADGSESAVGWARTQPGYSFPEVEAGSATYKGMAPGDARSRHRTFTAGDVDAYVELTGDSSPSWQRGKVPPPLLGGMISHLLGVDLPGPGTNWLRQRYVFHRQVEVGEEVKATVAVARLRPDKGLVDLLSTCSVDGQAVVSGQSLVWATDVADR